MATRTHLKNSFAKKNLRAFPSFSAGNCDFLPERPWHSSGKDRAFWRENPRKSPQPILKMGSRKKIRVASLFSGCGGSDLGMLGGFVFNGKRYQELPFEIVFALDNDAKAVATYNENFSAKAVQADIKKYPIEKIPDFDILLGGFPCQSFSTVNPTKDPFDDRARLYKRMARILAVKKPKMFIAENVKGLFVLQGGHIFQNVIREFGRQGYSVHYSLLNAADYGVPQKRQRVFMVGVRKDLGSDFGFPEAQFSENEKNKKSWVGLETVIEKLAIADKKYYFSRKAVLGMKKAKTNMKRGLAQDLKKPCLTVTSHLAKVSLNSRDPVLLVDSKREIYRRFSPLEAARIQSFPDSFRFAGVDTDAYRQIGNAIPPVMMWHVAKSVAASYETLGAVPQNNDRHLLSEKKKRDNVAYSEQEHLDREDGVPAFAF